MAINTKAEKTKQYIIESTASIFNKKGYAGTSLNDLMSATKLSKGCIYGNFENKDEIALAAFDYNKSRVGMSFIERILKTENSIERLLVYPQVARNFLTIPAWDGGCPILNTSIESDDTDTPLKQKAATALSDWQKSIEKQILRGIARKEIKEETNPKEIAVVIIFMIESAIMQTKISGGTTELNIAMDFLEKLIQDLKA